MNWKVGLVGLLGGIAAVAITKGIERTRYTNDAIAMVEAEKQPGTVVVHLDADADDEPKYAVGDHVIVACPYTNEMWGGYSSFIPSVYTVEKVRYIRRTDAYVYRISGDDRWYNENWLTPDTYGPMTVDPDAIETATIREGEGAAKKSETKRRDEWRRKSDELLDGYRKAEASGDVRRAIEIKREWSKRAEIFTDGGETWLSDILTDRGNGGKTNE